VILLLAALSILFYQYYIPNKENSSSDIANRRNKSSYSS
jgi:hypothetical protein